MNFLCSAAAGVFVTAGWLALDWGTGNLRPSTHYGELFFVALGAVLVWRTWSEAA